MAFLDSCRWLFLWLVALSETCAEICTSEASIHEEFGNASCDDVTMILGIPQRMFVSMLEKMKNQYAFERIVKESS